MTKKILLTGGHAATAALSVIEELIRRNESEKAGWEVYWVGADYAIEGSKVKTLESEMFSRLGISSFSISAGRFQRKFTFYTVPSLLKLPIGFIQSFKIILKVKPEVILSFGGYAAFPVIVVGFLLGIPIIIHEQTMGAGRANLISSFFARKILLARKESLKYFGEEKCEIVGNPIMSQILEVNPKKERPRQGTIYITGGSRGSNTINNVTQKILKDLLKTFYVIHSSGEGDFSRFNRIKKHLPESLKKKYEVYGRIDPMQIDGIYKRADILVGRSGANTVSEIIAVKIPSILIPLPISAEHDQKANALLARNFNLAVVVDEKRLSGKLLFSEVIKIWNSWEKIVSRASRKKSPDLKAAVRIVDVLEKL